MTEDGNKVLRLTQEYIHEQLVDETDPKAIKQLTAARESLEGLVPTEIERKYGCSAIVWKTVRFEAVVAAIEITAPQRHAPVPSHGDVTQQSVRATPMSRTIR